MEVRPGSSAFLFALAAMFVPEWVVTRLPVLILVHGHAQNVLLMLRRQIPSGIWQLVYVYPHVKRIIVKLVLAPLEVMAEALLILLSLLVRLVKRIARPVLVIFQVVLYIEAISPNRVNLNVNTIQILMVVWFY